MLLDEHWPRRESAVRHARAAAQARQLAAITTVVTHDDIHDAGDRVRTVERGPLWPANDVDALDRVRTQLGEEEWIGDLDAVDVHLRRADAELAGATQAAVLG